MHTSDPFDRDSAAFDPSGEASLATPAPGAPTTGKEAECSAPSRDERAAGFAPAPAQAANPTPPTPNELPPVDASRQVTPGLILMSLSMPRLNEVQSQLQTPISVLFSPQDRTTASRRLLAVLTDQEMRKLAHLMEVPDDGLFIDLYRRLSALC